MGLYTKLCRNTGLMIHGIMQPMREQKQREEQRKPREISRTVEEKQIDATTTLRRTTIDEIEVKHDKAEQ